MIVIPPPKPETTVTRPCCYELIVMRELNGRDFIAMSDPFSDTLSAWD